MAAYAALVSLIQIIDDLENHPFPPIHLDKQQVQSLTQNVMFLQEFLEGYISPVADGDEADPLEMRIADAAYAAQDVIESYIMGVIRSTDSHDPETDSGETRSSSSGTEELLEGYISPVADGDEADSLRMFFANISDSGEDTSSSSGKETSSCTGEGNEGSSEETMWSSSGEEVSCIKLYEDVHQVIEEMDLIKMKIQAEKALEIDTDQVVIHDQGHSFVPIASSRPSSSSSSSSIGKNSSSMVCSDDVLLGIMEKLVADQPHRLVIPIVGMGGVGKTTLARTVYSKTLIKEHFDICAWATISQQYHTREILCEILSQATNERSERSEDEVGLELYQYLYGRRFLIVLDDMWSVGAWDKIERFFPNNSDGSRVLVTTRISQLGSQLNNEYSHRMEFLDEANSWVLFSKTVFGENKCPPELEEIGKKIVENCRGLPLSIVVVGGILKNMEHTKGCWEPIRNNLTSVVNLENDKNCLRLLKLSYNHLPVYLKPCFLYMGVFEENDSIKVSTVVKRWVCEGFLKRIDGKSLETIAKEFLKELVDRNMIMINKLGSTGNIKLVKIHDLLRDLCLNEVKKEGFYHVVGQPSPRGISRQRRVVIRRNTPEKKVVELQCMSHVRSIISENENVRRQCRNMGLLRAFRSYYAEQYEAECIELQQCVNLQFLDVTDYISWKIFDSLNLIWNLHTLIVSWWYLPISIMPAEIWKMPQLRHLELRSIFFLPDPPSDDFIMENLQVLKGVYNFKCGEELVKRIPNIKKLELNYFGRREGMEHDDYCLSNIKLESLHIYRENSFRGNASLNKLTFSLSLKSLVIHMNFDFEWEGILERIGSLPNLEKLILRNIDCFGRGKWEVVEDQFPSLKYLDLHDCQSLKEWRAETEGSSIFPRLEKLYLNYLYELEEIPSEIGDIPTLQRIKLKWCNASAVKCAKEIVDEQVELQGDQLPFLVKVEISVYNDEALESLAGPNFKVIVK